MNDENSKQSEYKKFFHKQYIFTVTIMLLCTLLIGYIYNTITYQSKLDPVNVRVFLQGVTATLYKERTIFIPEDLTDEDFARITAINLSNIVPLEYMINPAARAKWIRVHQNKFAISNIKLLKKCANLEELKLAYIHYPEENIPKWMKLLESFGIFNTGNRFFIDLKPITYLTNLKYLDLRNSSIKNIKPLAYLINMKTIDIGDTPVSDLEPLKGLIKLEKLYIDGTNISDLEPLNNLKNLQLLHLHNCNNITDEQIEDLQNTLPELKIYR